MSALPPVYLIDEPDTFPWQVFHHRHPALIRRLLDAHPYSPAQRAALTGLLAESLEGVIAPLADPLWQDWDRGHFGTPWAKAPFLWAESYFYRRLLDAVDYFTTGVDPFAPFKTAELTDPALADEYQWLAKDISLDTAVTASLYGNQADLGFRLLTAGTDPIHQHLVVDDTQAVETWLADNAPSRVNVVLDNAGRELLADLVLTDHLLTSGLARAVVLHVKPHPYFVSDATCTDVHDCMRRLRGLPGGCGDRLHEAAAAGRLTIRTHPFHCAPLSFVDMPGDLAAGLAEGLTVVKGDLNYRRLVGDRAWQPTSEFRQAVSYFPGPVTVLRIVKSEVVLGVRPERLSELPAGWRVSGKHAMVSAAL
ncbi:damage-control phosphatase ARMT1 family protein [Actinocrispum wychmicini]|uniref:Uncharacterized protein DUF89 n=1 Tax=Actinocrispum wychmicini TaxID=1213861 RepID=A0A4V2S5V4_9PSEU|nr:damage-control phosphatase ARMT1 family protein [Actinocrispum wychmicini]TCO53650.1 uncharacterized protein DUF89 [Actinocrispum wychmicini]